MKEALKKMNYGKTRSVKSLERAEQFEICVLALVSATEFLDRAGSRLLNYNS